MKRLLPAVLILAIAFGAGGTLLAQVAPADNIPNWSVPATWSPTGASGGIQTMTDVTPPMLFVGVSPCRIADTRTGQGFSGQAGPGPLVSFTNRNFQITGSPATLPAPPAGGARGTIPSNAEAVSLQFTVVFPTSSGNLVAWQAGATQPNVSVINWDAGTVALGSGTIVPLSGAGQLTVRLNTAAAGQGAELVIDVNGYFSNTLETPQNFLQLNNNSSGYTAFFTNASTTCGGVCGIYQSVASGWAIYGTSTESNADVNYGVLGEANSTGNATAGVRGVAFGTSGKTAGVWGQSLSLTPESAGVFGLGSSGLTTTGACCTDLGVLGESRLGYATVGLSEATAGLFLRYNSVGTVLGFSWIASDIGDDYAFYASTGNYGGTGAKYFVEPHPDDPTKIIKYVSLEGPESGTYFRGKGKFQRGVARISVPEDFRIVTANEGLSIQVTPIGEMATVAVLNVGLDGIVVRGSRDVEFFYTVNGVRKAYADHQPIVDAEDGGEFMPLTADFKMPEYSAELKRRLIHNGTYNADGTPNMETAHKLGWDRIWQEKVNRTPVLVRPE